MKQAFVLFLALFSFLPPSFAQNKTYGYYFDFGLKELYARGPDLSAKCTSGTISPEAQPAGPTKKAYHFEKGCGLVYDDAVNNLLSSGNYTIELYFRIDTVQGYKKLIDFDSLGKDKGFYNQNGKLVLYPNFTSADSVIGISVFRYVAITHNATTKAMYINCNGKTAGNYTDNTSQYICDANKKVIFFQDDTITKGEHTKGIVAMIRISNFDMDSATIKSNFTNLSTSLGVGTLAAASDENSPYPNPAKDMLHFNTSTDCHYTVSDIAGKMLHGNRSTAGHNSISINDYLPVCMYWK